MADYADMKEFLEMNLPVAWTIEGSGGTYQVYIELNKCIVRIEIVKISDKFAVYTYSIFIERPGKNALQWIAQSQPSLWTKEEIIKYLPMKVDYLSKDLEGIHDNINFFSNLSQIQQNILKSL